MIKGNKISKLDSIITLVLVLLIISTSTLPNNYILMIIGGSLAIVLIISYKYKLPIFVFPIKRFKMRANLTPWDVENILRSEMGKTRFNTYDGEIKHSKFEFSHSKSFRKIPTSIVYGNILENEKDSIIAISIRPSYFPFLFSVIILVTAITKLPNNLIEFFQLIFGCLLFLEFFSIEYKYAIQQDVDFMNGLFANENN